MRERERREKGEGIFVLCTYLQKKNYIDIQKNMKKSKVRKLVSK